MQKSSTQVKQTLPLMWWNYRPATRRCGQMAELKSDMSLCAGGLLPNDARLRYKLKLLVRHHPKARNRGQKNSSHAKASCVPYVQLSGQFWTHKDQPVPLSILTAINPLAVPHVFTRLTITNTSTFICKEITNQC